MIEIFGFKMGYDALLWLAFFAASEFIGAVPYFKKNTVILEFLLQVVGILKKVRKEDESVEAIKARLDELLKIVKAEQNRINK